MDAPSENVKTQPFRLYSHSQKNSHKAFSWLRWAVVFTIFTPLVAEFGLDFSPWLEHLGSRTFTLHSLHEWALVLFGVIYILLAFSFFSLNRSAVIPTIALAFFACALIEGTTNIRVSFGESYDGLLPWELSQQQLAMHTLTAITLLCGVLISRRHSGPRKHPYLMFGGFFLALLIAAQPFLYFLDNPDPGTTLSTTLTWLGIGILLSTIFLIRPLYQSTQYESIHACELSCLCLAASMVYLAYFSMTDFDHYFFAAHGLQILAYFLPTCGLLIDFRTWIGQDNQNRHELQQLNQSLAESEQRIRRINEQLPVGILVVNDHGEITAANASAHEIFHYDDSELIGTVVESLIPQSMREKHRGYRQSFEHNFTAKRMSERPGFFDGLCKDGKQISLEIGIGPIMLDGHLHTLVTLQDLSIQKKLMDKLEDSNSKMNVAIDNLTQSNEQLERFAYICSHDLQEPVRMVQSFSQLLAKRSADKLDDKSKEYLDFITDGADRARTMITEVLQFCRLDQPLDSVEHVDLETICRQVHDSLRICLSERNASIHWDENLPKIPAVPSLFFQLMLNLVNNGIKFNRSPAPKVNINAQTTGDHWRISVSDNGIGIDPKFQQQIFNIFERLHSKAEFAGTGIGLATCLKITQQHHGQIEISSAEGQGSTFTLIWPMKLERGNNE